MGSVSSGPVAAGPGEQHSTTVLVRYFASARAASGVDEELVRLPGGASVADAVAELRRLHPGDLPRILEAASFLLDGLAVRDTARELPDGSELDVLPPFAGG
ncbi:molybdopterin converting factor small subunit [Prauserella shujinwangii]|uniref:Molybdopterin converting factor small subunit n=1 Tax=Prauserella shujinwangii TaxID=1453103 RepID=A0A2T0M0X2_9PSEU|nr:MoaD/ThiS family protein [Prauserella shujinwangii]PRX50256.1 molybdopterin converting factor small subunit [Prauserella shujinwangii]